MLAYSLEHFYRLRPVEGLSRSNGKSLPNSKRHSDPLFTFSYSVFKIEYILIKLVLLGLSVYGLYKFIETETGFSFGHAPRIAQHAPQ
jgi:hypothetical protein